MKKFLLSFLFLFFCACSFKPDLVEEPTAHSLHINEAKVKTDSYKSKKSLQILSIQSPFYLKTNKIYYRQGSVFGKYAKHVFSDSPVNFLEAKLKRYFENSKLFSAVMLANTSANVDYLLELDLESFEKLYKKEKVYVQDKLREQGAELWRWINDGAHIYVCGDANRMAKDVEQALLEVIAEFGGMDTEAADEFLSELRVERRYQRDVY